MTVSTFLPRGTPNPDTATGGRQTHLLDLQAQITALVVGSATADTFFSAADSSSATNIVLTAITYTRRQAFTTSGKSLTMPSCTVAPSCFSGAKLSITNPASAAYAFDIKDTGGNVLVSALAPDETALLELLDDSTANGVWLAHKIYDAHYGSINVTLIVTNQPEYGIVPYNCTIVAAQSLGDASGSWVVDVWKDTVRPENADSITAAAPITAASANSTNDTTLTGWSKALTAGDFIGFNLDSLSGAAQVAVQLRVKRT